VKQWNIDPPSTRARRFKQRTQCEHLVTSVKFAISLSIYRTRKQRAARMVLGYLAYRGRRDIQSVPIALDS